MRRAGEGSEDLRTLVRLSATQGKPGNHSQSHFAS